MVCSANPFFVGTISLGRFNRRYMFRADRKFPLKLSRNLQIVIFLSYWAKRRLSCDSQRWTLQRIVPSFRASNVTTVTFDVFSRVIWKIICKESRRKRKWPIQCCEKHFLRVHFQCWALMWFFRGITNSFQFWHFHKISSVWLGFAPRAISLDISLRIT